MTTWLVALASALCGLGVGYLLGLQRRGQRDHEQGVEIGRLTGYAEGRKDALELLQVKQLPVSRRGSIFPFSRRREGVRYELWINGVPTSFSTERWTSDEIEVDEAAMRLLIEAGVPALTGRALGDAKRPPDAGR